MPLNGRADHSFHASPHGSVPSQQITWRQLNPLLWQLFWNEIIIKSHITTVFSQGCGRVRMAHSGLVLLNINKFMIGLFENWCNRKYNHDKVIWTDLICIFGSMSLSMGFGFFCKSNFPASGTATVTWVEINFCTLSESFPQARTLAFFLKFAACI